MASAIPNLAKRYFDEVVPALTEQFSLPGPMAVPRVEKVVLNMGIGEAVANPKLIDGAVQEMAAISGQKPVVGKARKSIANFKLREGMPVGVSVTLRRSRMYEFLERLISVALPRVRDFRGLSPRGFDGRGNYTLGIREHIIFPEIDIDKVEKVKGLSVTLVTSAPNDEQASALLLSLGLPIQR